MPELATITSKRQLTIPANTFRQAGFEVGQKVIVLLDNGSLKIEPAVKLVEELAGSVSVPKEYRGLSIDKIITKAKKEYFKNK
ncbi:MAG: AbrB/MazE/SpoVT family DNA-binding domain-containing protein [Candidatus Cloacimonetes bacterium]|nr:AbrB/MazE/SpoVT family DNA-binding domain-containing protein [Candidatus Cloacimonadota bacterium]